MSDTCDVPLLEVLDSVPFNGRSMWEVSTHEHRNIPYGNICQQAAMRIRQLERELAEALAWKEQAMVVFNTLDLQSTSALLGGGIGEDCAEVINKRVPEVVGQLLAHEAQHVRDEADYNELEVDYRDSIAKHVERVEKLEIIIDAHKAALEKCEKALQNMLPWMSITYEYHWNSPREIDRKRQYDQAIASHDEALSEIAKLKEPSEY